MATTSTTQTKIITYYGWSDGYVKYDESSGLKSVIVSVMMGFVPGLDKTVEWVLGEALGSIYDTLAGTNYVTAETYTKYYYRNKAGAVYSNGYWYPKAYVGERRCFGWSWGSYTLSSGEPCAVIKDPTPKNADNTTLPTNYDSRQMKSHYLDDEWIMQKAIDTFYSGGYWDAYGQALIED